MIILLDRYNRFVKIIESSNSDTYSIGESVDCDGGTHVTNRYYNKIEGIKVLRETKKVIKINNQDGQETILTNPKEG